MDTNIIWGLAIPFIGTTLGAAMVFLMRKEMNKRVEKFLLGFASGVMIAASVWSLLLPAIEMAEEQQVTAWMPATVGFLSGMVFLLVLDCITPHLHLESTEPEGIKSNLKKTTMMVLAVTLHNIPERNGSRCRICRCYNWKHRNNNSRSNGISNRNCNSKLSRRCNNFNAT